MGLNVTGGGGYRNIIHLFILGIFYYLAFFFTPIFCIISLFLLSRIFLVGVPQKCLGQ
jgi:hypothetical protein